MPPRHNKTTFILPHPQTSILRLHTITKIILSLAFIALVLGFIATFTLNALSSNTTYTATFSLHKQDIKAKHGGISPMMVGDSVVFDIVARIDYPKFASLLRSTSISNVSIQSITYNSAIDIDKILSAEGGGRNFYINTTQDLHSLNLATLGDFSYTIDFYPLLSSVFHKVLVICLLVLILQILLNSFCAIAWALPHRINATYEIKFTSKDYIFLGFAFVLCFGIGAFSFWLGFPGFHIIHDTYVSIELDKQDAHPVVISYVLQLLYAVFGKHLFYLFLANLIPFYTGLFLLIAGFYIRFGNPLAILLIFPTFIANIYFQNFIEYHSFALPMMLFCLYSLLLFLVLVPFWHSPQSRVQKYLSKLLWILLFVSMFFAILWRHNAIFSVYPAFLIIAYLFLQHRVLDSAKFVKRYIALGALSAVLCLTIVILVPKVLVKHQALPANHLFLHQIAGACVPANDSSCFKDGWYVEGKNFSDVINLYAKYPLNADPMNAGFVDPDVRPFKHEKLDGLKTQWIKSIIKYPRNFLAHQMRFFKAMWWQNPGYVFSAQAIQKVGTHPYELGAISGFPQNETSITFSPLRERIYTFLYEHKFIINHIVGVSVGLVLLVLCSVLLWIYRRRIFGLDSKMSATCEETSSSSMSHFSNSPKTESSANKKPQLQAVSNALLIFSFSVSFACFFSAVFIVGFTPVPESRYMAPILPMAIIALVGFVAFVLEFVNHRLPKKSSFS